MSIANPNLDGLLPDNLRNNSLRKWACIASLLTASLLIIAKFVAYIITGSVSIMTSLLDSTFDLMASTVTLFSILHAMTPADKEHRFGHSKIEAMAALGQALFIFASSCYLLFESLHRFIHPQPVRAAAVGIGVMFLSVALTVFLVGFQRYVIRRTKSVAISADHLHYKGDLFMNAGVLAALSLGAYGDWPYFDPLFAAVISCVMLYSARSIGRESFDILMDRELSDADRLTIEKLVKAHPAVRSIHDLRTRHDSRQIFIEFHIEVDGELSLAKAHVITEDLEGALYKTFPKAEVLIHQEPAGLAHHRMDAGLKTSSPA